MVQAGKYLAGVGSQAPSAEVYHYAMLPSIDKQAGIRRCDLIGAQAVLAQGCFDVRPGGTGKKALDWIVDDAIADRDALEVTDAAPVIGSLHLCPPSCY